MIKAKVDERIAAPRRVCRLYDKSCGCGRELPIDFPFDTVEKALQVDLVKELRELNDALKRVDSAACRCEELRLL